MQDEGDADEITRPIIPTSEKAIGAIDLGLISGAAVIIAGLLVVRWVKLRVAAKLLEETAPAGDAAG
jgi:hypothetical protein